MPPCPDAELCDSQYKRSISIQMQVQFDATSSQFHKEPKNGIVRLEFKQEGLTCTSVLTDLPRGGGE